MKRLCMLIISCIITIGMITAQNFKCSAFYDGFWGNWQILSGYAATGNHWDFVFHDSGEHPSNWYFRLKIDNYKIPTKAEIKEHKKKKECFEYTGTFEYYTNISLPTIKSILKVLGYPRVLKNRGSLTVAQYDALIAQSVNNNISPERDDLFRHETTTKKMTEKVLIRIAPYDKYPQCYSIYINDVGFAFDLLKEKKWGEN